MSIFEINNIENYIGSRGWDWKSLIAVGFGFFLKLAYDETQKWRTEKRLISTFNLQKDSFKIPLNLQYENIKSYRELTADYGYSKIKIEFKTRFDVINSLDKLALITAFQRRQKEKDAHLKVIADLRNIDLIKLQLDQYEENYNKYVELTDQFHAEFANKYATVKKAVSLFHQELDFRQSPKDKLLSDFIAIEMKYLVDKEVTLRTLISLKSSYFPEISELIFSNVFEKHKLIMPLNEFYHGAIQLIHNFETKTARHISFLEALETSISEKYKAMYSVDIAERN